MTRNKPWRADNPDAVIVARPTKWGNPYSIDKFGSAKGACDAYHYWLVGMPPSMMDDQAISVMNDIHELRGKDLACWCPLDQNCHADVLLKLANKPEKP